MAVVLDEVPSTDGVCSPDQWFSMGGTKWEPAVSVVMPVHNGSRYAHRVATDPLRSSLGRNGTMLSSGEDSDLAFLACELGSGMGLFKRLRLIHIIPEGRLELNYLVRLLEGIGYSTVIVKFLHGEASTEPRISFSNRIYHAYQRLRMEEGESLLSEAFQRGRRAAIHMLQTEAMSKRSPVKGEWMKTVENQSCEKP